MKKSNIIVNYAKQHQEKNIFWGDYPCINLASGRNLKNSLGYYFDTWEDYIKNSGENERYYSPTL